ncbi:MAG: glycine cleavage system protein GcvH [Anaerolineaceae bacterium]|nr:glycine cleavage system protein GcvH [Anaerolineaceae bacterium]
MDIPSNLKYTKSHEWVSVEGDIAAVGITDYAQDQLSDLVYVEYLVDEGDTIENEMGATMESVKAAADVLVPLTGSVTAVNEELLDAPELLNKQPYEAWMIKVKMDDPGELDALMDAATYTKYCEEQAH